MRHKLKIKIVAINIICLLIGLVCCTVFYANNQPIRQFKTIIYPDKYKLIDFDTYAWTSGQVITVPQNANNEEAEQTYKTILLDLPSVSGEKKTYMDYRCIKDKKSKQYELQQYAYTDSYGYRRVGEYYMIALGSAYGTEIGSKYLITLESGLRFPAILGDCKADIHTDEHNKYNPHNENIVEYIVDSTLLHKPSRVMGDVSYGGFEGAVTTIEKIVND